jgi:hypothetical protein
MATLPISKEHITQLKNFIELCDKEPSIIDHPQLDFFKNFIQKLGGKVPKHKSYNIDGKYFNNKTDKVMVNKYINISYL